VSDYESFIQSKFVAHIATGFDCADIGDHLIDFQSACTGWALKRGRAALFEDTGLGKTVQQVTWAQRVHEHTSKDVLIFAPLCVAQQTVEEAAKFGFEVRYCRNQEQVRKGISITNYEMLDHFDPSAFVGVVLDESSILKSHTSSTRNALINAFKFTPYRLSCTATPSPNDFIELGNQSQFLGVMSQQEMLATFFTHDGGDTSNWRLKGHGRTKFWEWMATWAICIRNPADLGFDGSRFNLPALQLHEHVVDGNEPLFGQLFAMPAQTLAERREAKRASVEKRVALAAEIVNADREPHIVWCHLNDESTALAKAIPDAVEVTGSMSPEEKERRIMAFTHGDARVIVTKPSIAGYGLNWQHCANMTFAGMDDSFESYYQAVRRCHRFGQTRPVNVHLITSESEGAVKANIERKQRQHDEMSEQMVAFMRDLTRKQIHGATSNTESYNPTKPMQIPSWLSEAAQ